MRQTTEMTTPHPYLIRAFYEWITDNGMTPYISVDAEWEGVEVPREFVVDGEIVLNISMTATHNLDLGLEHVTFGARFSGRQRRIMIPVAAVQAIFAKENGQGMALRLNAAAAGSAAAAQDQTMQNKAQGKTMDGARKTAARKPGKPGKPTLTVVK